MKDTATSLSMGLGHLFVAGAWKLVLLVIYAAIYTVSPFQLSAWDWWVWVLLFFADDLAFYCYPPQPPPDPALLGDPRGSPLVRALQLLDRTEAGLVAVHRLDVLDAAGALLFEPWMIFLAMSWSLLYQFTLHTEAIDKLPRPIEWFFNTPSHHRVHHGSQEQYLDRNYGGILIIWDRMFGSFEPEDERVRYGLTKNIETFHPVKVAYGEFANIWRDVRAADNWRDRFGYAFKGPGWKPGPEQVASTDERIPVDPHRRPDSPDRDRRLAAAD